MATHRIPILSWATVPSTSGGVFFEPVSVKSLNEQYDRLVTIFNQGSLKEGISGAFGVPQNYAGNAKVVIVWTTTATTNNVVWDFEYSADGGNDLESLDAPSADQGVTVTDAAPSAAWERMEVSIALTSSNFATGDTVQFNFFRDQVDVNDTLAAAAILFDLLFEYDD